jgi:hypothetical protein
MSLVSANALYLSDAKWPFYSGSQRNFMTESQAQKIKLTKKQVNMPVYGIIKNVTTIKHKVVATIKSRITTYSAELKLLVIPKLTGNLLITPFTISNWNIPITIQLADPHFSLLQPIDILLEAEIFFEIWTKKQLRLNDALPPLKESLFGWVVAGKVSMAKIITQHSATPHNFNHHPCN